MVRADRNFGCTRVSGNKIFQGIPDNKIIKTLVHPF
jgi:hypothetical protein